MKDIIKIINETVEYGYRGPKYLYKYRPFDKYTYDMFDNNYVFLCMAKNLDDEQECETSIDYQKFIDLESNNLKAFTVEKIIDYLSEYTSKENLEEAKRLIKSISKKDGSVRPNFLLDIYHQLSDLFPNIDIAPFINYIVEIPLNLNEDIKNKMEDLVIIGYKARELVGICSLTESNCIDRMWNENYGGSETGYCIEYDVSDYELNKYIYPVVYSDERETNIIFNLVNQVIGESIYSLSNNEIEADRTQYLRQFLVKHTKWEYQREWRLIGEANAKVTAPKIKAIYLGKNVAEENKNKMTEYCKKYNINLIQR